MLRKKGFTLVEIMIVVAIIGLLAAIAIPNFVNARTRAQTNACIANLKQIQGAIQVWALDTGGAEDTAPTEAQLVPGYLKAMPHCGAAAYVLTAPNADPVCPNNGAGHTLAPAAAVPEE